MHLSPYQSMTSREIADLTGKRHDHVLRDIRAMLAQVYDLQDNPGLGYDEIQGVTFEHNEHTKRVAQVHLDKDHTLTLLTGYDAKARHRVVKRWQELESAGAKPALPNFADPVAAARAWADAKEAEQKALAHLEAAKPAVEFHARVADTTDAHSIDETAKLLRCGPRKLREWLRANRIMRIDNTPYQEYMNRGYFRVIERTIDIGGAYKLHAQTYCTGKGLQWLQRKIDHQLMDEEI